MLRNVLMKILIFIASKGKTPVKIGYRPYLDSSMIFFLSSALILSKKTDRFRFGGDVKELVALSAKLGRPLMVHAWERDEYGSSDGAGFIPMDITITVGSDPVILAKELSKKLPGFYAFSPGEIIRINSVWA